MVINSVFDVNFAEIIIAEFCKVMIFDVPLEWRCFLKWVVRVPVPVAENSFNIVKQMTDKHTKIS